MRCCGRICWEAEDNNNYYNTPWCARTLERFIKVPGALESREEIWHHKYLKLSTLCRSIVNTREIAAAAASLVTRISRSCSTRTRTVALLCANYWCLKNYCWINFSSACMHACWFYSYQQKQEMMKQQQEMTVLLLWEHFLCKYIPVIFLRKKTNQLWHCAAVWDFQYNCLVNHLCVIFWCLDAYHILLLSTKKYETTTTIAKTKTKTRRRRRRRPALIHCVRICFVTAW
jgi:hypothetical protein